jgi:nitroreductase
MIVFDLSVTDALLSTTRAVRKRLDLERAVPREVIRECLELALQAPSGSNRQGWRWLAVSDPDTRRALAGLYRKGAGAYLEESYRAATAEGRAQDGRVYDSARYLAEHLAEVPVHVIPCIDISHLPPEPPRSAWAGLMGSIMPAVWSFQLALRARGLGTVLTTLHLKCEAEAAALLGIPGNVMQCGLLPVAYTLGTDFKPARRRPLGEVLHWDRW